MSVLSAVPWALVAVVLIVAGTLVVLVYLVPSKDRRAAIHHLPDLVRAFFRRR